MSESVSSSPVPAATPSSPVFAALPGLDVPVAGVHRALAAMWEAEPAPGRPAPPEVRASQMNLVLHFGLQATPEIALHGFETALAFSRHHPCRIIVLCPRDFGGGGDVSAKIFSECHLGAGGREKTCTEAIILTYPLEQRGHLENQASVMIESDLPLYYWPQRIEQPGRMADYPFFTGEADRIVIDSAVECPGMLTAPWPNPSSVRDLAWTRTLPIRQAVGHFLSYIPPARLATGLRAVTITVRRGLRTEAERMLDWVRQGIVACGGLVDRGAADRGDDATFEVVETTDPEVCMTLRWTYEADGWIEARLDLRHEVGCLEAALGPDRLRVSSNVRLLPPEKALAEALFF